MQDYEVTCGDFTRLGAHHDGNGVNFAVFSANAARITVCLFSPDGKVETARIPLREKTGSIWHGYVPGLPVGTLYGLRAHGSYAPERGHRFNENKLLLDPYTREMRGQFRHDDIVLGYDRSSSGGDLSFDTRDSAAFVPKSVVSDPSLFTGLPEGRANLPGKELIYEAHVKGLTQLHPDVSEKIRGTYEGLASDAVIDHLLSLGVTAIELLPVHSFIDDGFLVDRGLKNYWGYNSIGFFAPEPRYFGPAGIAGFRDMVAKFRQAGISTYLDVVYNHTAEGDHRGPTYSFRGLDNASYYRLISGQPRYYVNDTGCGNTVNVSHPFVLRMVTDSLRFWVEAMGIDGFRFDLATTMGREDYGFDPHGGFFDALRQDPCLSRVRMIAEPWDIGPGGYQLGGFPSEFSEWNDVYRDTIRRYWRGDPHSAQELGARLLGSADRFDTGGRRAWSSINYVSAHDGFTLADITRYNNRHNEANTENNQDGHHANFSDNCGVEGETDDPDITARRAQRQRNMLATLFLSQGTPMLLAGDEIGNSQAGNNNAYCQDNATSWIDWDKADTGLLAFVRKLAAFRRDHAPLRQTKFLHGAARQHDGYPDVEWSDFGGEPLLWRDPNLSTLCLTLRCSAEAHPAKQGSDLCFIVFNREEKPAQVTLPARMRGRRWVRCIDTAEPEAGETRDVAGDVIDVAGSSVVALTLKPDEASDG